MPPSPPTSPSIDKILGASGEDAQVLAALVTNIPIAIALVALFLALHYCFESLFYTNTEHGLAPAKPAGAWGWLCSIVWGMADDEYMKHSGLDALVFIEFLRLGARVLIFMLVWSCFIDMTFYVLSTDETVAHHQSSIDPRIYDSFLARASLANVRPVPVGDGYDWDQALAFSMSLVGMWLGSIFTLWQLKRTWRRVIKWSHFSMAAQAGDPTSHAILVRATDPREHLRSPDELRRQWDSLYPGEVHSVRVVRETGRLPSLLPRLDELRQALALLDRKALALAEARDTLRDGGAHAAGNRGGGGNDAADKRTKAQAELAQKLLSMQAKIDAVRCEVAMERKMYATTAANDVGISYFVLFKSARTATIAKQVVNVAKARFEVLPAPTPDSVRWMSLKPTMERARYPSSAVAKLLYYALLFLWAIPIAFVSSLMSLDALYKHLPFLEPLVVGLGPTAQSFVAAFLPTVALLIFNCLLPYFCIWIVSLEGHECIGRMQGAAFVKLFIFEYVWSFLGLAIGSSLLKSLTAILEQPSQVLTMLSSGLADAGTTFICLLVLMTCVELLLNELARPIPIALTLLKRAFGLAAEGEPPASYPLKNHVIWSQCMFAMMIGICYSSIAPITTIFAVVYVLLALALYKRNLLYNYSREAESRGSFVPMASGMLLLVLGTAQLLLAAVHIAKGSFVTFGLLLPLLAFTYLAHAHAAKHYALLLHNLPLADKMSHVEDVLAAPQRAPALVTDMQTRFGARLLRRSTREALDRLFGDAYTQPELVHSEILAPLDDLPQPTHLVSCLQKVPCVAMCCPCLIRWTERPEEGSTRREAKGLSSGSVPYSRPPSRIATLMHSSSHIMTTADSDKPTGDAIGIAANSCTPQVDIESASVGDSPQSWSKITDDAQPQSTRVEVSTM